MAEHFRPTCAEIDLSAIRDNVSALKQLCRVPVMVVVKADGYGHGAVEVARASLEAGAEWLAVALLEEALELREAAIIAPILLLAEPEPSAAEAVAKARVRSTVYSEWFLRALASEGPVPIHVKVDTGMHRLGAPPDEAVALAEQAVDYGLELEGLWTHLAVADDPDDPFTGRQVALLLEVAERIRSLGIDPGILHAANSAGAIWHPESRLDMVRTGIAVYGLSPNPAVPLPDELSLRPAMSVVSKIEAMRILGPGDAVSYGHTYTVENETVIATVPIGYADGYPRALSNNADVLMGGERFPVVGSVTMDHILVDVGIGDEAPGPDVVLIGRQGESAITADEFASWFGSISYEAVSRIGPRVRRVYR